MARKPNYSFEKQKKEKDRKAKKDAKRVARLERKKDGAAAEPGAPESTPDEETPELAP